MESPRAPLADTYLYRSDGDDAPLKSEIYIYIRRYFHFLCRVRSIRRGATGDIVNYHRYRAARNTKDAQNFAETFPEITCATYNDNLKKFNF